MHRIDTVGHVGFRFDDGTPPADGTICDAEWLNAVQEELCEFIEAYGQTLAKGTWSQLQDAMNVFVRESPEVLTAGGTATAYTISADPTITAYAQGQRFSFKVTSTNSSGAVTLNVDSVGAVAIKTSYGWDPIINVFNVNAIVHVIYNAAASCFELLTDRSDFELQEARGSAATLDARLDGALNPAGYVDTITQVGGNCLVQHWYRFNFGGGHKSYNMTFTWASEGTYNVVFGGTPYISVDDYMLLFSSDAGPYAYTYHAQITLRTATTCTIKTYKEGVLTDLDADHNFAFIGKKY